MHHGKLRESREGRQVESRCSRSRADDADSVGHAILLELVLKRDISREECNYTTDAKAG
jgi:hypothetical protein